mmetsp:Transcript_93210/g.263507  ORF Transcript_93210/g.263507 Transcript_93210/m.263507 type:complete len:413 (+) Transcript_93210:81-1319(+)|eukprot:CAMPEP_0168363660 /NCGR_PEP_ID=MMETSP0228-20121227/3804_1 /TAXON_ID=133427 /ORGANISM="Protoceratium reticulatum, Strain CCCM 535 (=CCMP 1889)" /LENGTH=412 /DNA_ID=CAMNT_0008376391 /DNA_START=31 /DNA_END=1269 /DNA_ORIENTATION=+
MSVAEYRLTSAVAVEFKANFISVSTVDTVQQVFNAHVAIRGRTVGLASTGANPENWEPRIRILNLITTDTWKYRAKVAPDGEMEMKWTIGGTFAEAFELQTFPRDRQDLSIRISSKVPRYILGPSAPEEGQAEPRKALFDRLDDLTLAESILAEVHQRSEKEMEEIRKSVVAGRQWLQEQLASGVLKELLSLRPSQPNNSVVQTTNFCMASTFDISSLVRMCESQTYARDSTTAQVRPLLKVSLSISRCTSHFFWNIELPMAMITLFAAGTFLSERSAADRLGLSLTLVLTAVAFKFILTADLPKISYLTGLDAFVLFNFFGIGLVVLENSLCETRMMVTMYGQEHDHVALVVWLAMYTIYMLYYAISAVRQVRTRRAEEARHEMLASPSRGEKTGRSAVSGDQSTPLLMNH